MLTLSLSLHGSSWLDDRAARTQYIPMVPLSTLSDADLQENNASGTPKIAYIVLSSFPTHGPVATTIWIIEFYEYHYSIPPSWMGQGSLFVQTLLPHWNSAGGSDPLAFFRMIATPKKTIVQTSGCAQGLAGQVVPPNDSCREGQVEVELRRCGEEDNQRGPYNCAGVLVACIYNGKFHAKLVHLLRCGGPKLKSTQVYPRRFGNLAAKPHLKEKV